ncbi:MAG: DUF3303 family protein [Candidatus Thorarchaeota archaeon]|jgi:hypothetical protein|nr:DUF3303 family protein [Candidatus Thorarchaeota archaeon]
MKYIAIWEYDPKDLDAVQAKWKKLKEVRKKKPELFPKSLSKAYVMFDGTAGFQLYEADSADQISGMVAYYTPEVEFRFTPITELKEAAAAYEKLK